MNTKSDGDGKAIRNFDEVEGIYDSESLVVPFRK